MLLGVWCKLLLLSSVCSGPLTFLVSYGLVEAILSFFTHPSIHSLGMSYDLRIEYLCPVLYKIIGIITYL